jgi:Flp pilus assembly protein TadD
LVKPSIVSMTGAPAIARVTAHCGGSPEAAVSGNRAEMVAAFRRALALDPGNGSPHLDLADAAAEDGDFAQAATSRGG